MGRRKKLEPVVPAVDLTSFGAYDDTETIGHILEKRLKNQASFTTGVTVAPCVILWTDPEGQWKSIINDLKQKLPEL